MSHFVKSFDCNDEKHVMWLKEVGEAMTNITNGKKVDVISVVNNSPLSGNPSMDNVADWAYVHFQLTMKYANAVLNCDAFIPSK